MEIELNYEDNKIVLNLIDVDTIFSDEVLESDKLGRFQIINKEIKIN